MCTLCCLMEYSLGGTVSSISQFVTIIILSMLNESVNYSILVKSLSVRCGWALNVSNSKS